MNIKSIAKQWLIEHEFYEHSLSFEKDLNSLCGLLDSVLNHQGYVGYEPEYDSKYGDDKLCECGHPYYRHFDTYDDMEPIGCKYCSAYSPNGNHMQDKYCPSFKEKKGV